VILKGDLEKSNPQILSKFPLKSPNKKVPGVSIIWRFFVCCSWQFFEAVWNHSMVGF
jgi:hypothetical protein